MKNIYQLVYRSRASEDISYSQIQSILESAEIFNRQNNLTGLLVYKHGYFLQLIEGERLKVLDLYRRILKDPRHSDIERLAEGESTVRVFNRWPLVFHDGDIDSERGSLASDLFLSRVTIEEEKIIKTLESFRQCHPAFHES